MAQKIEPLKIEMFLGIMIFIDYLESLIIISLFRGNQALERINKMFQGKKMLPFNLVVPYYPSYPC